MEICERAKCTGCMACRNVCKRHAIRQEQDALGFYRPFVDMSLCVQCGLCKSVCPENASFTHKGYPKSVFAGWHVNEEQRKAGSSGGLFAAFAEETVSQNGVVFGAIFDPRSGCVKHASARTKREAARFYGSKYVQSDMGFIYKEVAAALHGGSPVLFSGTPCQNAGLKRYLGNPQERLLQIDVFCHGVASPVLFQAYLDHLRRAAGCDEIVSLAFRCKERSWESFGMKAVFINGTVYQADLNHDLFLLSYLKNYTLQTACYHCPYADAARQGDISLGDFWGYTSEDRRFRNDDKGISAMLINSEKGAAWARRISGSITGTEKTIEEAIAGNRPLSAPVKRPVDSDIFQAAFAARRELSDCAEGFLQPVVPSIKHKVRLWADNHCYLLPKPLRRCYISIKRRRTLRP